MNQRHSGGANLSGHIKKLSRDQGVLNAGVAINVNFNHGGHGEHGVFF